MAKKKGEEEENIDNTNATMGETIMKMNWNSHKLLVRQQKVTATLKNR